MVMLMHTKYRKCPYMEFLIYTILIIIIVWLYTIVIIIVCTK